MKIEIHDPGCDDTVEAENTSVDAAIREYISGIEDCFGSGPFDILAREVGARRRGLAARRLELLLALLDALVGAEHAAFVRVDQHRNHQFVELRGGPLEDVDVPQRDGVERPRANRSTHG